MAIIEFDAGVSVTIEGSAYVGDSYRSARAAGQVDHVFYFDHVIAVPGLGFWVGQGTYSTDPVTDSRGYATMSYDLSRTFSLSLTAEGKTAIEESLGEGYKLKVDYQLLYTAENPNVPAYSFGPHPWEADNYTPGPYAVQEGFLSSALGSYSHSEGYVSSASGKSSHAEGIDTYARGEASHAEGDSTIASGSSSHAEGYSTGSSANGSHAEGRSTIASGDYAHAEGYLSWATKEAAHAQNYGTRAASQYQTALGKYNVVDANDQHAVIIGNGTSDSNRSNALAVGWDGSVDAAGDATIGGALDIGGAATAGGNVYTVTDAMDRDGEHPSARQYSKWFQCSDKDGEKLAVFGAARDTDGRTRAIIYGYNENAGGTETMNFLNLYVDQNGNCTYGIADPAAFCTALHVGELVVKDQSKTVSMANSTYANICSISLAAGTWVIEATAQFANNATGRRFAFISATSASSSGSDMRQTGANANAVSGSSTLLHCGCTKVLTATTTIYLVGWQNSGAALDTYGCISAVRIK